MSTTKRFIVAAQLIAAFGCMSLVAEPPKANTEKKAEELNQEIKEHLKTLTEEAKGTLGLPGSIKNLRNQNKNLRDYKDKLWIVGILGALTLVSNTAEDLRINKLLPGLGLTGLGLLGGYCLYDVTHNIPDKDAPLFWKKTAYSAKLGAVLGVLGAEIKALSTGRARASAGPAVITGFFLHDLFRKYRLHKDAETQDLENQEPAPEKEKSQDPVVDTESK